MKKSALRWWIIGAVVLVVYHVIIFAVPFEKSPVFFLSWLFTLIAIGSQAYVVYTAFGQDGSARSKFYGFPIARVGAIYVVAQLVLGLVFMVLGEAVPMSVPLVAYVVLLGAAVIGFIATDTARDEITRQDMILAKDVAGMRAVQSKVSSLVGQAKSGDVEKALKKLAEDLRYSDPVSAQALQNVEADLSACIDEIQNAVINGNSDGALVLCEKASGILIERNRLCKLNKST